MVIWMQYSQHHKRDTKGVRAANSLQEKNSKISGIKTFPFIGYIQGKRGAQRCSKPTGRSPALKPQQRQWHTSGQGEKPGGDSPAVSNGEGGEGARGSQILCSPYGGGRNMPSTSQQPGGRRSRKWFSGSLCFALLRLLMEDKNKRGSWSGLYIVSFLQQGAPCLAGSGGSSHRTPINNNAITYVNSIHCTENLPLRVHINLSC